MKLKTPNLSCLVILVWQLASVFLYSSVESLDSPTWRCGTSSPIFGLTTGSVRFHTSLCYWLLIWTVAITYLQHTDPSLPHYTGESWNYVRGAAATIDRDFGFIGRHIFHGIIETHVLHHYVSTIPFYHADEASEAIKPVMGRHYRSNVGGGPLDFLNSLWMSARWCQWVEPSEGALGEGKGILFFRNRNGLGVPPLEVKETKPPVGKAKPVMIIGDGAET